MPRANDYGRTQGYHRNAHLDTCILVQVETRAALKEIEAIAAVEGVDGIFIGPSDLAADMGHLGNPKHPDVQAAIKEAARRIRATGKSAGLSATSTTRKISSRWASTSLPLAATSASSPRRGSIAARFRKK